MLPYWLMSSIWLVASFRADRRQASIGHLVLFALAAVLTTLMIGLRFEIGGDWASYQRIYNNIYFVPLFASFSLTDPGYAIFNWLSAQGDYGLVFVDLACAIIFMAGLVRLALRQPNPALAMLVAVPYLIIVVAMGYTRQATAIGVICFALADLSERRLLRFVLLVGVAALFHKTAVLVLPIALVPILRRNLVLGVVGGIVFAALFYFLLRGQSDRMVDTYVNSDYNSQGAAIRVVMNLFAAVIFLALRKRIVMVPMQKSFWTTSSIVAILAVGGLAVASASSGIDRLSLYLIPLQVVTLSRLPYLLSRDGRALPSLMLAVVGYSIAIQFIWLNYADNVVYWVPYKVSGLA